MTFPLLAIGATIAKPSVVLCNVNPTIRKVPRAALPNKTAALIAKPSPKLCRPIPMAIVVVRLLKQKMIKKKLNNSLTLISLQLAELMFQTHIIALGMKQLQP
jgi:hypothetical protein